MGNMKHRHLRCFYFVLIVLQISIPFCVNANAEYDDSWMEPESWSDEDFTLSTLHRNKQCCKCAEGLALPASGGQPQHQETPKFTEDGVALMYLRRWMSLLFDRKKLMRDDQLQTYERSLTFFISSLQLDKIEKWEDPRDLDEVITEIFAKADKNKPHMGCDGRYSTTGNVTGFKALVVDIFIDLFKLTKISEIRFLLIAALVVICGWFLHKRYHISYLTLFAGSLFLYGYLHTYLECNRELEVNEMMESLQQKPQINSGFMGFLKSMFSGWNSNDEDVRQMLIKSTRIKLGFCRPDHVAIIYFNDIFLKYLQVLLEQCTSTLKSLQMNLPWPYNYFASFMLICLIGYLLKLTFKYILSPAAWILLWHRNSPQHPNINQTQGDANAHNVDRISGDNLKILLSALPLNSERNNQTVPKVSGVEEVREAIESVPANDTSTSSVSNSDTSVNSPSKLKKDYIDPLKELTTKRSDIKLEDLTDDT